ncbi:ABC transporter ATP-binding protein [Streptomyces spectabilis]|uniref:ABC transporter ATP-binding protein n=1 Tax=Streptomyces spectabilis TaxID=68270 RepID=A0A5P2XKK6_STRST|nr:ABC transporter ATP-binding protein [Streptomyces spectabilis]MBB5102029.1 ATP-binding cassette subfamily B protein [Streptomyces spectabilis]MCI3907080.1 ABC transporter ATP-binding protein/permease [Streptomyces spectabilis]QEV63849.1 ABC transporter ATP-binding protein [Streptomyces spectabilis]GGV35775.1 ABC transporter ATP-binding protein [Streptomyces spectabilis]
MPHVHLRHARLAPAPVVTKAVATAVAVGAGLLLPVVLARVVDRTLAGHDTDAWLLAFAGLLIVRTLAEAGGEIAGVTAETSVLGRLRHQVVRQVFLLGVPGSWRHALGDLIARLSGNAVSAAKAVPYLIEAGVEILAAVCGAVALCWIDWRAGLTFLATAAPLAYAVRRLALRSSSAFATYLARLSDIAARLTDAVSGRRTIRACGTGPREVARVLAPLPDLARAGMATWQVRRSVSWQVAFAQTVIRVLVLLVAGLGVADGRISPGAFFALTLYLTIALGFVQQVDTLLFLADARAGAARVRELLEERTPTAGGTAQLPAGQGELSFRGVSVRHGSRTVLDAVSLDVPAGAVLAVVGPSSSGKTTLGLLAGRLIDPDEGEVLLEGVPLRALDPAAVHAAVGYAFGRPVLLGETIGDAIGFGSRAGADAEHAARIAQADDFIRRLPAGYHTRLDQAPLSGGERQRIGLARAIAGQRRVLVLDDATSSLDTVTEAKLAAAFTEGLADRTRLVIAHRAVTAARADLVAWIDEGRVRAVAPHHTLWATDPRYRAVFGSAA